MINLSINIDDSCNHCKKGLKYLQKLFKKNRNAYGNMILIGTAQEIKGLIISPDYNSKGYLTHFHIRKER